MPRGDILPARGPCAGSDVSCAVCLPESLEKITPDQAFEVPLPDESCRKRLFELYARGLKLGVSSFDGFVKRTEGASAAFIRELLRKAALFAADDGSAGGRVEDRHIDGALRELVVEGGELTRSLLGYRNDA